MNRYYVIKCKVGGVLERYYCYYAILDTMAEVFVTKQNQAIYYTKEQAYIAKCQLKKQSGITNIKIVPVKKG